MISYLNAKGKTIRFTVRPEVTVIAVQVITCESKTSTISHANGLQCPGFVPDRAAGTNSSYMVLESRADSLINEDTCNERLNSFILLNQKIDLTIMY